MFTCAPHDTKERCSRSSPLIENTTHKAPSLRPHSAFWPPRSKGPAPICPGLFPKYTPTELSGLWDAKTMRHSTPAIQAPPPLLRGQAVGQGSHGLCLPSGSRNRHRFPLLTLRPPGL